MRRRSAALVRFVSNATRTGRSPSSVVSAGTTSPSSIERIVSSCCSASTSVGAMNAPW